ARQMSAAGVHHVHAHFASHPAVVAFIIRRLAQISYSFTAHGSDLYCDRHMLREKVAEAAFVVAISQYTKDLIVSECDEQHREKVAVIHCGVDTLLFCPHRNGQSPASPALRILCTGTLYEVKGQRFLIEACTYLQQRRIPFECHFVG